MSVSVTQVSTEMKRVLALLSSSAEQQLAHLREIGCEGAVDELALELDDLLPQEAPAAGLALSEMQRAKISALQLKLTTMSGAEHKDLWEPEALADRPEWAEVRRIAGKALRALK